ncbi:hypothetical protein K3495_g5796 [Podosphaera aphanis]|nr:hypothetical protein K3495_g5796 [Podosphaera aphanis]
MSASLPFPPPADVNMSDESQDVLSNLSGESLQGLLRLLIGSNAQAPPNVARRDVALVKWDGDQREFPFYIQLLEARNEEKMDGVLLDRSICLDMVNSLPIEKRPRVASWNEFEDKQARLAASEKFLRMEQNDHQYFGDFIKDYEYQVAISGDSWTWTPSSRVNLLNAAINHSLRKSLDSVKLPSDENYSAWVAELKEVADKLEALPEYRPKGSTKTSTKLGSPKSGSVLARSRESVKDQDGDTIMRDVDLILATVSHLLQDRQISSVASVNSRPTKGDFKSEPNSSRKPPAPW